MSFQAYLDNIKSKTGKSADDFKKLAKQKGLLDPLAKAGDIIAWLKKDFDLGHGHSMAIFAVLKEHTNKKNGGSSSTSKTLKNELPKLAAPAQRALAGAGITSLKQLSRMTEKDFSSLHGIGKNAVDSIKKAMKKEGLAFK